MILATWNVNSLRARMDRVSNWLSDAKPDVLCIQETKLADDAFPSDAFAKLGYECAHFGQGQWNGVAILSRVGIADVTRGLVGEPRGEARAIGATCSGVRVYSLYVPNGRSLDDDHYRFKLEWMEALAKTVDAELARSAQVVLGGDFNIAYQDIDVWDPHAFLGSTHVSAPEREALERLFNQGMIDLFRCQYSQAGLFSWWDYRGGSFHKRQGMRIDLILGSAAVAKKFRWALIDRNQRKGSGPSDHAPVVVEFATK